MPKNLRVIDDFNLGQYQCSVCVTDIDICIYFYSHSPTHTDITYVLVHIVNTVYNILNIS
jgi:hypothetical protein